MIITISLVNIHHLTVTMFLLMMRIFKIYSLSNSQIYNTVLLTIVTMLYITPLGLICFITGSFYLLTPLIHFFHHLCQPPIYYSLFL